MGCFHDSATDEVHEETFLKEGEALPTGVWRCIPQEELLRCLPASHLAHEPQLLSLSSRDMYVPLSPPLVAASQAHGTSAAYFLSALVAGG